MTSESSGVFLRPLSQALSNDFPGNVVAHRRGFRVEVRDALGQIVWSKEVWERGVHLPFRPGYERRIQRAKAKAHSVLRALGAETEGSDEHD